jgi:hypothetical protein
MLRGSSVRFTVPSVDEETLHHLEDVLTVLQQAR